MIESQIDKAAIEDIAASSKFRLEMWTRLINLTRIQQMAEIGVWKGEFAEAVLYLGGDDLCPTIWRHSLQFEPTLVFPFAINFADAVGATIYCLPFNQFLMRKASNGQRQFAVIDFTGQYRDTSLLPQLSLQTLITKSVREMILSPLEKVLRDLHQKWKMRRN